MKNAVDCFEFVEKPVPSDDGAEANLLRA